MNDADCELLRLAAKAARVSLGFEGDEGNEMPVRHHPKRPNVTTPWNPLDDDGDALRLAMKLDIELRFHRNAAIPSVTASCKGDEDLPVARELWGADKEAATRRAIVRTAAEVGRKQEELEDLEDDEE